MTSKQESVESIENQGKSKPFLAGTLPYGARSVAGRCIAGITGLFRALYAR